MTATLETEFPAYTPTELAEAAAGILMDAEEQTPGVVDHFAKASKGSPEAEVKQAGANAGMEIERVLIEHTETEAERQAIYEQAVEIARNGGMAPYRIGDPVALALSGDIPQPTFLVPDRLYEARYHLTWGKDETMKTRMRVWDAGNAALAGKRVGIIEYEVNMEDIAAMLEATFTSEQLQEMAERIKVTDQVECDPRTVLDRLSADLGGVPDLLQVDSLSEAILATDGDENSAADTLRVLAPFRRFVRRHGATLDVIDHIGANGDNSRPRGSTVKRAIADSCWSVEAVVKANRERQGRYLWTVRKDRPGALGTGTKFVYVVGDGAGRTPVERVGLSAKEAATPQDETRALGESLTVYLRDHVERDKRYSTSAVKNGMRATLGIQLAKNNDGPLMDALRAAQTEDPRVRFLPAAAKGGSSEWWYDHDAPAPPEI